MSNAALFIFGLMIGSVPGILIGWFFCSLGYKRVAGKFKIK